ncbi:metabotropic glutamate receptor 1-like [Cydia amplana]|uniref:metabotropic glutamate receptor 1-like n=1 Tax=Cydia amplana TaxID=1869771 RepID=UPI002FE612EF
MAAFREEALVGGVCVAREEGLRAAPAPAEVDAVLERLARGPRVAVCWCEGRTARALLAGMARSPVRRLRLVGSDGWADRGDVVAGLQVPADGALTLRIRSPYLDGFDTHYHNLHPRNNTRNPWFQEFWEQKFNCSLAANSPVGVQACTGTESLARGYSQEPKLALVVRGVYALAHALHAMRAARCGARPGLCAAMLPFNVSLYQAYLQRVRFTAPDGALVAFDDNGDPPPELSEYDVMSFERGETGTNGDGEGEAWHYVRVGRWRRGQLHLRGGRHAPERRAAGTEAVCSAPCAAGQWARAAGEAAEAGGAARRAPCCWTCVPCAPLAVTRAPPHAGCRLCPPGHRPDVHRKLCLPSPVEWGGGRGGGWARALAGGAGAAGLAGVSLCAATFWRHRGTPVVKSASRELCALLLVAAALCHVGNLYIH